VVDAARMVQHNHVAAVQVQRRPNQDARDSRGRRNSYVAVGNGNTPVKDRKDVFREQYSLPAGAKFEDFPVEAF